MPDLGPLGSSITIKTDFTVHKSESIDFVPTYNKIIFNSFFIEYPESSEEEIPYGFFGVENFSVDMISKEAPLEILKDLLVYFKIMYVKLEM